jgi:hypothetical protein
MEAETPSPAAEPGQPPPPPPPPGATEAKASGGIRLAAVVLALVLAFGAAVMIVASIEIGDTATCDDVRSGEALPNDEGECFDGSSGQKTASLVLTWPGGVVGAIAALAALAFAIRGRGGSLAVRLALAAVALSGIGILVGSV